MSQIINKEGKITRWPKKPSDKEIVIQFLAEKFQSDMNYSEKEVNAIINVHHTFEDTTLLRRELISRKKLSRFDDGSQYWKK
ncbi:MAG: DUF2087 domain-containing protein [Candidatus Marinimicrobia bacterium]|jgi:hypothetical protein|nr:DUF2087 domain-containing protein [Candidatus Neomarinimicrobiota bacterium]